MRAAHPGFAGIFTAEETNIRIGNELPFVIEWIEMNAVIRGDVEPGRCPAAVRNTSANTSHTSSIRHPWSPMFVRSP